MSKFMVVWRGEKAGEKPEMRTESYLGLNAGDVADQFIKAHKGEVGVPVQPVTKKGEEESVTFVTNASGRALIVIIELEKEVVEAKPPTVRKA